MNWDTRFWIRFSFVNLCIVAALGVIMRYKIGFDFPYLSQKNIQHAHSHFAFVGWITHTIYVLLIYFVTKKLSSFNSKQYKVSLIVNLVCSYGMLISFFTSGYSFTSIALSTLTIVNNCYMTCYLFSDFRKISGGNPSIIWFKSALWFNIFSSIGTFYLAYIMASRNFNENWYLASVYFYLHFQYNGFFTFACLGLVVYLLPKYLPSFKYNKTVFTLFFASCIPAYFLSTLWANLPIWLYAIVVIAAFAQFIAWLILLNDVRKSIKVENTLPKFAKFMLLYISFAFTIKLLLQLGSTIPELSKLAFGFRPVVIAYLHLVLLAIISVFLLAFAYIENLMNSHKKTVNALIVFLTGIFLNELVLAVQGVASFSYFPIKFINETLFIISLILITGAIMIVLANRLKLKSSN